MKIRKQGVIFCTYNAYNFLMNGPARIDKFGM